MRRTTQTSTLKVSPRSMAVAANGAQLERHCALMLRGFTMGADCGQDRQIYLYAVGAERSVVSAGMKLRLHRKHSGTGAFVAAPIGGLLWALGAFALRIGYHWIMAKVK